MAVAAHQALLQNPWIRADTQHFQIVDAQRLLARLEGIWTSPEGAANVAALIQMKDAGVVAADTRVMMIFTGCGIKNPPPPMPAPIDLAGSDADVLARVKQALGL